jgi:hypothetical protein
MEFTLRVRGFALTVKVPARVVLAILFLLSR